MLPVGEQVQVKVGHGRKVAVAVVSDPGRLAGLARGIRPLVVRLDPVPGDLLRVGQDPLPDTVTHGGQFDARAPAEDRLDADSAGAPGADHYHLGDYVRPEDVVRIGVGAVLNGDEFVVAGGDLGSSHVMPLCSVRVGDPCHVRGYRVHVEAHKARFRPRPLCAGEHICDGELRAGV